jgi:mediator of RNA polymerase II transcription subunit 12
VEILLGATSSGAALSDCLSSASEVLDAVRHLTIPSSDTTQSIPGFNTLLHEHLMAAVHDKFIALDQIISSEYQHSVVLPALFALLRLLQFTLAFRGIWSDTAKDRGISLSPLLFRLTLVRRLA